MPTSDLIPAEMTAPRWRALAALLMAAITITDNVEQRVMFQSIYDDLQRQVNVEIHPIQLEDKS